MSDKPVALHYWYRRTSWLGGGSRFVVILAANQGGGVMEWKGPREWAIERDSVRNKKNYAQTWGYELEIVDMSTKKRYAHEWRESWEKVDTIRNAMRKYPRAQWFVDPWTMHNLTADQDCTGSGGWISTPSSWSPLTLYNHTCSTISASTRIATSTITTL